MRKHLLLVCCLCLLPATEFDHLRDPRPQSHIADPDGLLTSTQRQRLEDILREPSTASHGEVILALIRSGSDDDVRSAGTRLFNRWEPGNRFRDDGILIVVDQGSRACEIILGDGVDDDHQVATSQDIFDHAMVPRFRANDLAGALEAGAHGCIQRILQVNTPTTPSPEPPQFGHRCSEGGGSAAWTHLHRRIAYPEPLSDAAATVASARSPDGLAIESSNAVRPAPRHRGRRHCGHFRAQPLVARPAPSMSGLPTGDAAPRRASGQ